MGYTHYWRGKRAFTNPEWTEITKVFNALRKESSVDLAGGDGEGEPSVTNSAICFNGRGDDESFETFVLSIDPPPFEFCKTARRPYDEVVVALLMFVSNTYPDNLTLTSDGNLDGGEGKAARILLMSI